MDIMEIMKILRHRYPFLMVDRITEYSDSHVVGYKNVTINEPFFQGHFPGEPVMPGVLILESMGQVASVMVAVRLGEGQKDKIAFLAGVDNARFRSIFEKFETMDKTIVTIVYDMNIAARFCDVLSIVYDGRIIKTGTPKKILKEVLIQNAVAMIFVKSRDLQQDDYHLLKIYNLFR